MEVSKDAEGLEVVPGRGIEPDQAYAQKETAAYNAGLERNPWSPEDVKFDQSPAEPRRRMFCGLRLWIWISFAAFTLVTVGAVTGGILGAKAVRDHEPSATPGAPPSAGPDQLNKDEPPTDVPFDQLTIQPRSGLASVAWNGSNDVMQYRVYFQDGNSTIRESAWNSTGRTWYLSNPSVGQAKRTSPIAAALTNPQDDQNRQIHIFSLNKKNRVDEHVLSGDTWSDGPLIAQNVVASSDSNLAAIWHQHDNCASCPNTLVMVYQDRNQAFILGNYTGDQASPGRLAWSWSTLTPSPTPGSGVSLSLRWERDKPTGLRLYYQSPNGQLRAHGWDIPVKGTEAAPGSNWYERGADTLPVLSMDSNLASFAYGTAANGNPLLLSILSSSSSGVTDTWWSGVLAGGGQWGPVQNPLAMNAVAAFTNLAVNSEGHAFAMAGGKIKEFRVEIGAERVSEPAWFSVGDVVTE
ncbi:MAG: hypothetical protein M1817_000276 [Caeruleum heppii]|nr:MAG: hypothetical protein M1817_000276 [Caeruleum heppii]